MKLRKRLSKANPLALLFLISAFALPVILAESESSPSALTPKPNLHPRDASTFESTKKPAIKKRDAATKGTKDAPVDGLDGKPHRGPFVNPRPSEPKANPSKPGIDNTNAERHLPEDSVMNDPNRKPPRKGTTGTEGGVSEKERDRKARESEAGRNVPKPPDSPREAPHAHYSGNDNTRPGLEGKNGKDPKTGGVKLEKPDLPAHEYISNARGYGREYGFDNEENHDHPFDHHWDGEDHHDDDDDDDDWDEDGIHDFIPWDSFAGSFSSIAATEIGDKTFIVAALMAMRHSRFQVFTAAASALLIMTVLSGMLGHAVGAIISKRWSALVAALLFLGFGAKSLREGYAMSPNQGVSDEIREVQAELEEKEEDMARHANGHGNDSTISPYALEAGRGGAGGRRSRSKSRLGPPQRSPSSSTSRSRSRVRQPISTAMSGVKNLLSLLLSPAWVETFSMTFVGELGDRSQIATVAMAAGQEFFWVMVGASLGHLVCTGVAVVGGSVLAGRVSLRKVTLIGGGIFIGFGFFTLIEAIRYWL